MQPARRVYDVQVPTRQQWQKMRDTAKVPKGLAKVSMGDAIQKFHDTFHIATIQKHEVAAKALEKACDDYLKVLEAKYKDGKGHALANSVKDIAKEARYHYNSLVKGALETKTKFYPVWKNVDTVLANYRRGNAKPKDVAAAVERLAGLLGGFARIDEAENKKVENLLLVKSHIENAGVISAQHMTALENSLKAVQPKT